MSRNLVICLDGTNNEPETGPTNVARLYEIAAKDGEQVVYYDPGVGTMGARSATTRFGKALTRAGGLVLGHGVKDNIAEAYTFLMRTYQTGDRIFVFGFSRGAYTALALTGMLRTVGLLRPGAENLVPYALKLYTRIGKDDPTPKEEREFWKLRSEFNRSFGNPDFPDRFDTTQVRFLGIWDAVKTVGWFNLRARFQQARWPFTRKVPNVEIGRHALAIDENRRPYAEYRFDEDQVADGNRLREVWFAGVHSDVGGKFPDDHRLSDIALRWITDEAIEAGLRFDPEAYVEQVGVAHGAELPDDHALGRIHTNGVGWAIVGLGWRRRKIRPADEIHPSVHCRVEATLGRSKPYQRRLPGAANERVPS